MLAGALVYAGFAMQSYRASVAAARGNREGLQTAVRLEPGNAEYHYRLAQHLFFSGQDARSSLENYRKATTLNPHVAAYWLQLAEAYRVLENPQAARKALLAASRADPMTPSVAWTVGNFYLSEGDVDSALRQFHAVLAADLRPGTTEIDPKFLLNLTLRATGNVQTLLDRVLPPKPHLHLLLLQMMLEAKDDAGAAEVWKRLLTLNKPFAAKQALAYVNYLLAVQRVDEAAAAWQDMARVVPGFAGYLPSDQNLIVNPRFDEDNLNGGFDWQWQSNPAVQLQLDSIQFHISGHSLAVIFDGRPVSDIGLVQMIPVRPQSRYKFTAFVRSEKLESANGPRFVFSDAYTGEVVAATEEMLGSRPWTETSVSFTTGVHTRLLALRAARDPANTMIRGKLWIDDLRLGKIK